MRTICFAAALLQLLCIRVQAVDPEPFLQGMEVVGFAMDIADFFIGAADQKEVLNKLKEIKEELDAVKKEEDQILADVKALQSEVAWGFGKITDILKSQELDDAHATITGTFDQLQTQAHRGQSKKVLDELADSVIGSLGSPIITAREKYLQVFDGTLQSNIKDGRTILEYFWEESGFLPVKLAQSLARSMVLAQAIITWAYVQRGDLVSRKSDIDAWTMKYQAAWERANKNVFYNVNCSWGSGEDFRGRNISTLTCRANEKLKIRYVGQVDRDPSGAPELEKEYGMMPFNLRCTNGSLMAGMQGSFCTHTLWNPWPTHSGNIAWQQWYGFRIHCTDGTSTSFTPDYNKTIHDPFYECHYDNPHHGKNTNIDFHLMDLDGKLSPVTAITGCSTDGRLYTRTASADFGTMSGMAGAIGNFTFPGMAYLNKVTSHIVPCYDRDFFPEDPGMNHVFPQQPINFTCPTGYAMAGISGNMTRDGASRSFYGYVLECDLATDNYRGSSVVTNSIHV